jgi:hypothetical protein
VQGSVWKAGVLPYLSRATLISLHILESSRSNSHETACLLNASGSDAHVALTIFFADRDPVGPYRITVPARHTLHLRFNDLVQPSPVPRDTDFSSTFESDVPIVVRHTRLDSRHAEVSLLSTTAYSEG